MVIQVGTAGWSIPSAMTEHFPSAGTHLERYARTLSAVEINTSFYRPHRRATYEKWAAAVPADFRFSVKLPKTITHEARLVNCSALVDRFAEEIAGLGDRLGPVLVQLPPSFAFPGDVAERFFEDLSASVDTALVLEPRHASWFTPDIDEMLIRQRVARVAADPAKLAAAAVPGGSPKLAYYRLHGAPRIYASLYERTSVDKQALAVTSLAADGVDTWTIYDNTMYGAATQNAIELIKATGEAQAVSA